MSILSKAKPIQLGKKYRDTLHGFTGTATSLHTYIHGCDRVVLETLGGDGKLHSESFDVPQVVEVETDAPVKDAHKKTGGPQRMPAPRHE